MKHIPFILAVLATAPVVLAEPADNTVAFTQNKQGVSVLLGDTPIAFYQAKPKPSEQGTHTRNNYLHPLYGLDGQTLTEDFPADHLHHRGVFWTWHQVVVNDAPLGDAWVCKDFIWDIQRLKTRVSPHGSGTLDITCLWKSPLLADDQNTPVALVRENTSIVFHPAHDRYRLIDFTIALTPLQPSVKIGGSNDSKGYSGFSARLKLAEETRFTSSSGLLTPQKDALPAGPWVDIARPASENNPPEGVAILQHPDNPHHFQHPNAPQPWILRQKRSMQNPAYPGRQPTALPRDRPLTLRYRLVIHRADLSPDTLNRLQKDYNND